MCEGRGGAEGWDARVDERTMSRSRDMTGSKAPLIASGYQQGARATAMLQGGSFPFDFGMWKAPPEQNWRIFSPPA